MSRARSPMPAPAVAARTIVDHLRDPESLGGLQCFRSLDSWSSWCTFLRAIYGLEMSAADLVTFTKHTGRTRPSPTGYREAWAICGRQSGKSRIASAIADYAAVSAPMQETEAYCTLVGQDERGAQRTLLGYAKAPFQKLPAWRAVLRPSGLTKDTIRLANRVSIVSFPCRPEALRGYVNIATVVDEAAFFTASDGHRTDAEVLRALRPSLATTGGKLIVLSSPYGQAGSVYEAHARFFGAEDTATLVWRADSLAMHPTLDPGYLAEMEASDPEAYRSEILAEFRAGLSALFDPVALDRVTDRDVRERAPIPGVVYFPFFDASSGRHDRAALAIWCVADDGRLVQVLARAWAAPHSPADVRSEVAAILRVYNCPEVYGDLYAIGLQEDGFRGYGITYARSHADASTLALTALSLVNSGRCLLLDLPEQRRELIGLERRRGSSGRDRVGHSRIPDDLAVACCGGMVLAAESASTSPSYELTAHERSEMAAVSQWLGGAREGEVVDREAGYEHEDMRWRRTGPDGRSYPLW